MKRSLGISAAVGFACVAASAVAAQPTRPLPPSVGARGIASSADVGVGRDAAASTQAPAAAGLTRARGAVGAAPAEAQAVAPAARTGNVSQVYERVRRGVVAIERRGVPVAIGTVLGGDGRILTALSGLGGAQGADVRYADGSVVHAKVDHVDPEADLALLVSPRKKWTEGLSASEANPTGADLHAIATGIGSGFGAHFGPTTAAVKGPVDAHARDGKALPAMLDVALRGLPVAGAPLLDSTGSVVGVLVHACKGRAVSPAAEACTPIVLGAPVSTIRSFLSALPSTADQSSPWLGIRGEADAAGVAKGVRVLAVAPQSPAEASGLKPNADIIVAIDGLAVKSPEILADIIDHHAPGDTVKLLVLGDDKFREVPVALKGR